MNKEQHSLWAAATEPGAMTIIGALVGAPWSWQQIAAGLPIAVITAMAPDLDNLRASKKVDQAVYDEALGGGGPLGHRQLTHWWGLPVGLGYLATLADLGDIGWIVYAALWGYLSHILLDLPFGEQGMGAKRGVPLILWYGRVGGWFYSDRLAAHLAIWPLCLLALWAGIGFPFYEHLPYVPAVVAQMQVLTSSTFPTS